MALETVPVDVSPADIGMPTTSEVTWLPAGDGLVPGNPTSVALVASSPRRWAQAAAAFSNSTTRVYTQAGNPILPALARLQLGAVVELNAVAPRDALFLLPFSLLGGLVRTLEGQPIDLDAAFANVTAPAGIPPYVAAASDRALEHVVGVLNRSAAA